VCWRSRHILTCELSLFPQCVGLIDSGSSVRFAPPLVIEEEDLKRAVEVIGECLEDLDNVRISCLFLPLL
jgi:adenosylmethionine-8-amino-7-oxononanoate aminotransferase